jgi:hypothetical protein
VESVDELAEGHGPEAVRLMETMAGESAVLCTHGDVATALLEALVDASEPARAGRSTLRLQKGEFWVVQSTGTRLSIVEHVRKLAAPSRPSAPSAPSAPPAASGPAKSPKPSSGSKPSGSSEPTGNA